MGDGNHSSWERDRAISVDVLKLGPFFFFLSCGFVVVLGFGCGLFFLFNKNVLELNPYQRGKKSLKDLLFLSF